MKRFYAKAYAALFLVMGMFSFVACEVYVGDDDYNGDRNRAAVLSGEWQGEFGMFYAAPHPVTGELVQFDASYTNIVFYPAYTGARRGTGKQVDYYNYGPYSYQYYYFNWEVRNRDIYITYPSDPNLNVVIYDYNLSNNNFVGYMGDSRYRFSLRALSGYKWGSYNDYYYYGPNSNWSWGSYYYSQGLNAGSFDNADSSAFSVVPSQNNAASVDAKVVRGNRFLKAAE